MKGTRPIADEGKYSLVEYDVVIASGGSASEVVPVGTGELVGVTIPAAWDTADITFQTAISPAGTFRAIQDSDGDLVRLDNPVAGRYITVAPDGVKGIAYIKLISTNAASDAAATQSADRTLSVRVRRNIRGS